MRSPDPSVPRGSAVPRVHVVVESADRGEGSEALCMRAQEWSRAVSAFLALPVLPSLDLHVHAKAGVAWAAAPAVHLYQGSDGCVDLTQLPHELVHVIAGASPSRMMSEGLAVHAAATLGLSETCWPCFRLRPDMWMAHARRLNGGLPNTRAMMEEMQVLRLSTLDLRDPEAVKRSWLLYVAAGSFVGYLFDTMDRAAFWASYRGADLAVRSQTLRELERGWQAYLPEKLDSDARALLTASLADARLLRDNVVLSDR